MSYFEKNAINTATENWFKAQCKNEYKVYHLYCKIGAFTISDTKPDDMDLVSNERISIGWTKEMAAQKIYDMLCKAPCVPETGLVQYRK